MKWKSPRCSAACWDEINKHDALLDRALTALQDMRRDRDEWKQQHENLLAIYRAALAHPLEPAGEAGEPHHRTTDCSDNSERSSKTE